MADEDARADLDRRIAAVRENIRTLVEQAAAYSGAADETRTAYSSDAGAHALPSFARA
jgi:hypothetical protein